MVARKRGDKVSKPSGKAATEMGKTLLLENIYYGENPGALRGPTALYNEVKAQGHEHVTKQDCVKYLQTQPAYTLYRPARKKYQRNQVVAEFSGQILQVDIMDVSNYSESNNGFRYIFLGNDTYSKTLISFPIRNRKPASIIASLQHFIDNLPFTILNIFSDQEGSILSKVVKKWLESKAIRLYTTTAKIKAPGVERMIRTLRTAFQRHFESSQTFKWLEYLPKFQKYYNNRKHSTTRQTPNDIVNNPLAHVHRPVIKARNVKLPPIGSFVRLNRLKGVFDKEASGNYTAEIFTVSGHKRNQPIPMITVTDQLSIPILGSIYPEEFQVIKWTGEKQVDQVFETRKRRGKTQRLVSYVGYPAKFKEWIF